MEIIKLHHPYQDILIPKDDVVLILGFFDGIHLGHQKVIHTGIEWARRKKLKVALLTFNQHASKVCLPKSDIQYLCTFDQKAEYLEQMGIDYLYQVAFTSSFSKLKPQEFVKQYIVDLHAKYVVAGEDYTYGPKGIANMTSLPLYAGGRFEIVQVSSEKDNKQKISSTKIRYLLQQGDVEQVCKLLGRPYVTRGLVVHGEARGRTLGYPTANLQISSEICLPKEGIYSVKVKIANQVYLGMASIGHNVTFGNYRPLSVEVNILDFAEDIYGEELDVSWCHYLRSEKKFASVDELIKQLEQDEKDTRAYFAQEMKD